MLSSPDTYGGEGPLNHRKPYRPRIGLPFGDNRSTYPRVDNFPRTVERNRPTRPTGPYVPRTIGKL